MNPRKYVLLFLILFMASKGVYAQIDTVRFNKQYIQKYWTDTKLIVRSPLRWKQNDWIKFGVFVSGTAGLTFTDQAVKDYFQSHKNKTLSFVSDQILEGFEAKHSLMVISGILSYGLLTRNERAKSTSLLAVESFVLATLVTRATKTLAGRERPDNWEGFGPYAFHGPLNGMSFPSGHTTASFAVASVIATQYRDSKWIPVTVYSVATLAGLSRIYDNKHWLTDVVAGAAVGTAVGNLVSRRSSRSKLSLVPFGTTDFQGIKLAYIW